MACSICDTTAIFALVTSRKRSPLTILNMNVFACLLGSLQTILDGSKQEQDSKVPMTRRGDCLWLTQTSSDAL